MKINFSTNRHIKSNVSFKAGKVELFSDFDRTYFPCDHRSFMTIDDEKANFFRQYCADMKKFLQDTKDDLKFHISSGRTFGEYESVSQLIRDKGFELPLPETYIAKNGGDEYIRTGTEADFYQKGIFPFQYDKINTDKEKKLSEISNWDGEKIKNKLKEILKKHDFRIIEADTENSVAHYGEKSFFSEGKIPYEDRKKFHGKDKPEWIAGLRRDGKSKMFITYPPDMEKTPERVKALQNIRKETETFLSDNDVRFHIYSKYPKACAGRYCEAIEPFVDENLKRVMPEGEDGLYGLTKAFDIKEAIKNAIKNNDLVIAAGDGINDIPMLHPLSYIELPKDCSSIDDLDPVKHAKFIKEFNKMPFIGIVVDRGDGRSEVAYLADMFGQKNNIKSLIDSVETPAQEVKSAGNLLNPKIVKVQEGHLEEGIKEAIALYSEQNPKYKAKLGKSLKKELAQKIEENIEPQNIKKSTGKYFIPFCAGIGILGAAVFTASKIKSNKQNKQITPQNQIVNTQKMIKMEDFIKGCRDANNRN